MFLDIEVKGEEDWKEESYKYPVIIVGFYDSYTNTYHIIYIGSKYKFNIPNARKRSKHLGSTGILMWRKSPKDYYLVKFSKHHSGIHSSGKRIKRK